MLTFFRLLVFAVVTPTLALLQLPALLIPPLRNGLPLFYHRLMCRLLGVHVRVHGDLPQAGTLIVCNHISWFDVVLLGAVLPVSFVAKSEVKGWPVFGWLARLQGSVFVTRKRGRHTVRESQTLTGRLARGDRLVLFAEGTSSDGIHVLPFKSALFSAVEKPTDGEDSRSFTVQPAALRYTAVHNIAMGRKRRISYAWVGDATLMPHFLAVFATPPLTVDIMFQPPLPPALLADRKAMARQSHQAVRDGLDALMSGKLAGQAENG